MDVLLERDGSYLLQPQQCVKGGLVTEYLFSLEDKDIGR